jgi:acetyltransferase EpsM
MFTEDEIRPTAVIIIGAGGHSHDIVDICLSARMPILGFLDDNVDGSFILGRVKDYKDIINNPSYSWCNVKYVIGINDSVIRKRIDQILSEMYAIPATIVHGSAIVGSNAKIGPGCVLGPGAILTTNVTLGRHVHLNTHASVNQGSTIGDYCTLSPGVKVCGDVVVGDCVQFGANSSIINMITVGDNVTLGAGAVVVKDLPSNCTAVGVPAKVIKEKNV